MDPKISVIIPVYNGEKFLERSVESVIGQTYQKLECIIVDDGSIDRTGSLCVSLQTKDSRIRYVRKTNGGVSSARNEGLRQVTGDYICFLDSDDYLDGDLFDKAVAAMNEEAGPDIIQFGFKEVTNDGTTLRCWNVTEIVPSVFTGKIHSGSVYGSVWSKLIKVDFYRRVGLLFCEQMPYGEDILFSFQLLTKGDFSIAYVTDSFYRYFVNPQSVSRNLSSKSLQSEELLIKEMETYDLSGNVEAKKSILNQKFNLKRYFLTDLLGKPNPGKFRTMYKEVNGQFLFTSFSLKLKFAMMLAFLHLDFVLSIGRVVKRRLSSHE